MSDTPWVNNANNDPLRNLLQQQSSHKESYVPSMAEMAASMHRSSEPVPNQMDMTSQLLMSLIQEIKTLGEGIVGAVDTKYLSKGTVFLICIDRNVKPDTDSKEIPQILVASPNVDIKIVSYQEYESKDKLKEILLQYNRLIEQFNQMQVKNTKYFIFLGRLIENIRFDALDFTV